MKQNTPFVEIFSEKKLKCTLCPHECVLGFGKKGKCGTRQNVDNQLVVNTYGRFHAVAVDPIEKKPLSHFYPGSQTFSLGTAGCNMVCPFCQNASLSQCPLSPEFSATSASYYSPEEIVDAAKKNNCSSISFTYSEPTLSLEYALQVALLAETADLDIVFVTNGQINERPLQQLCTYLAAANVDLKSFQPQVYKNKLGGDMLVTIRTIEQMKSAGVWVELTTLIVPGMNDSKEELTQIAKFIAKLDCHIPWHVSRFHPAFKERKGAPTSISTIATATEIGRAAGLKYVYAGNIPGKRGENTYCPNCQDVVVHRVGYDVVTINTSNGKCIQCGCNIAGIGFP